MPSNEPTTLTKRFFLFCLSIFAGIVLLYMAVQLLAQFWGWLALLAVIVTSAWVTIRIVRTRRDRW